MNPSSRPMIESPARAETRSLFAAPGRTSLGETVMPSRARPVQPAEGDSLLRAFHQATGLGVCFTAPAPRGALGTRICWPNHICALMRSPAGCLCAANPTPAPGRPWEVGGLEFEPVPCLAGLWCFEIPVGPGAQSLGRLRLGQAMPKANDRADCLRLWQCLGRDRQAFGLSDLESAWARTPVVPEERIRAALLLLAQLRRPIGEELWEHQAVRHQVQLSPVERAMAYAEARLDQDLSTAKLAEALGCSTAHFCRMFRRHSGTTFSEWLARQRIARATQLLLSSRSTITDAALAAGFQSISHFNALFRRRTGLSPAQYRRHHSVIHL